MERRLDRRRISRRHREGMMVAGDDELPEEPSIIVINSAKMAVPGSTPEASSC